MNREDIILKIENERKQIISKFLKVNIISLVCIVIGTIIIFVSKLFSKNHEVNLEFLLFYIGAFVIFIITSTMYNKKYSTFVKLNLENKIIESLYNENCYTCSDRNGISFKDMNFCNIFKQPDEFNVSQTIYSKYKDIDFCSTNYVFTIINEYRDSKGNRRETRTNYPGRYLAFKIPKNFDFGLSVIEKSNHSRVVNKTLFKEKIEFESIGFNKKFNITTTDKHKTFFVIRPREIINIIEFDKTFNSHLSIVFSKNKIMLLMADYNDKISYSLFSKMSDKTIDRIIRYYSLPHKIIDDLGLYKSKFKVENDD